MRASFLILVVFVFFSACSGTGSKNNLVHEGYVDGETPGKISFEKDFHDFGTLEAGEIVSYSFEFTNTGKSSLLVKQVRASCGCTSPSYTKTPIGPGEKGKVDVEFDSSGFQGLQNKSVWVTTNGQPSDVKLHFSATVE